MAYGPTLTLKASGSVTSDPASIGAGLVVAHTFTATGAKTDNSLVVVNMPSLETNVCIVGARVTAANTIEVRLYNPTAGAINPASQEIRWAIF